MLGLPSYEPPQTSNIVRHGHWEERYGSWDAGFHFRKKSNLSRLLCSALSLSPTEKLLNWRSADRWLLEKCISGSQGMWRFRASTQGTAGGHGVLPGPSAAHRGRAALQGTGTEPGAWVSTGGTRDPALGDEAAAEPSLHSPGSSPRFRLTLSRASSQLSLKSWAALLASRLPE